jgi:hypothetical protein
MDSPFKILAKSLTEETLLFLSNQSNKCCAIALNEMSLKNAAKQPINHYTKEMTLSLRT